MRIKNMRNFKWIAIVLLSLPIYWSASAKSQENLKLHAPTELYTVFSAGDDDVNTYRIPSLVVANDGSITVFAEARRISWQDKSRTDLVVKRSTDGGRTWGPMKDITNDTTGAYMDPTPVVDKETGEIFLFCNFWPTNDHSGKTNRSILITSQDNGVTWNAPQDVTNILLPDSLWSMGFGPGKGFQISKGAHKGRLIMPMRVAEAGKRRGFDFALYSDDHGKTWQRGEATGADNEFQIAEAGTDTLIYNARNRNVRSVARSFDGGVTWTKQETDTILPGVSRGCQASVLGTEDYLYFCGIDGIDERPDFDERARLALYRSSDGGYTWPESRVLYEAAAGYACIDELPDGRLAIIFEDGNTPGFTRKSVPGTNPPQRPAGWMRLDMLIVDPSTEPMAPVKVATQPSDAYIGLSMLPDGEIRHYNYGEQADEGSFYLSSRDGGMTWKKVRSPKDMPNGDRQSPKSGEFIRLTNMGAQGVYAIRTEGGIEGNRTVTKVDNIGSIMIKPPVFTKDGKIVVAAHGGVTPKGSYTYVSDDDGKTWKRSNTVTAPDHVKGGFHKGTRWNHGAVEPTVIELNDGRLWMLMRTAQDYHYESFSDDGGLTWSESQPSTFYGTITMPTLGRLEDGRLLFLWTNTTPLPELETANGVWDDVFTNRDVTHAAISDDDGKTWRGFRELMMDPLRNEGDYALRGGGIDRGMHQAQFVEPAPGRIVAALGQHPLHRGIVVFDADWLLEDGREDDFSNGTANWSTFNYVNGIKGHCSYNRVEGTKAVAHPDKSGKQALWLKYEKADSLVNDVRGAVWNFPAARKGEFKTSVKMPNSADNVHLILNDRWMNACDTVALYESQFVVPLNRSDLGVKDDGWHEVLLEWNLDEKRPAATVTVDGVKKRKKIELSKPSVHGVSYAHFIAVPTEEENGIFVEQVSAKRRD